MFTDFVAEHTPLDLDLRAARVASGSDEAALQALRRDPGRVRRHPRPQAVRLHLGADRRPRGAGGDHPESDLAPRRRRRRARGRDLQGHPLSRGPLRRVRLALPHRQLAGRARAARHRRVIWITELEPSGEGTRLAVKDLFDTAGVRTTYGSAIFRDHAAAGTAPAVTRLERAGYVPAGKANLHEFAWGITSENPHYGDVPNPTAPDRVPGGSSGGNAAALVLGQVDAALGTDSGGSVRIPAACCGIVGFKPTHGL